VEAERRIMQPKVLPARSLIVFACLALVYSRADGSVFGLEWTELPPLTPATGQEARIGLAGVFAGVSNDVLIVAGGATISASPRTGTVVFHDDIAVLEKDRDGTYRWTNGFKLPKACAYGAAVSTEYGLVCIGGRDGERTFSEAYLLQWDSQNKLLHITNLPSLPAPCAYMSAACIGSVIYVAGGTDGLSLDTATRNFWCLDLSLKSRGKWQRLMPWPGAPRAFNLTVHQHNGRSDCIYVIGGITAETGPDANHPVRPLADAYEFTPSAFNIKNYDQKSGEYSGKHTAWRRRADIPSRMMALAGMDVGQSHIFVLAGEDVLPEFENYCPADWNCSDRKMLAYHTITDTWVPGARPPVKCMHAPKVPWGNSHVILGEVDDSTAAAAGLWRLDLRRAKASFGAANFLVLVTYLLVLIGIGVYFFFQNRDTEDFFRGGQRVPWFAAACSIFATMLSSITFIAIPAKAYATDWTFMFLNFFILLTAFFVIAFILPFFRKIDATSAYEYLEKRFNLAARLFGSASFILFQVGRMAIVTYLPSLALAAITPLSVMQCILTMGFLSVLYCSLGGLRAVIWTDTIQTFVLLGGAFVSLLVIILSLKGGAREFVSVGLADNKFNMINWDWSPLSFTTAAFWVIVLGGIGQNIVPYVSDQAIVQRYMSVSDENRAAKAIFTNGLLGAIPATLLFFGIGTALFVFYKTHPQKLDPSFQTDGIFCLFMSRELPVGIAGLVVAGVFAAAQSTISTSMNSISTALVTDFLRRFNLFRSERLYLAMARVTTIVFGCLGIALALLFALSDIKSLWDKFMEILGLFGGAMCGLFLLGIFSRKANGFGAVAGAFAGAGVLFLVQRFTRVHFLLYPVIGITVCFAAGLLISLFSYRPDDKKIAGLTYWTRGKRN
jgi:SSS family solute:Na+ symporter